MSSAESEGPLVIQKRYCLQTGAEAFLSSNPDIVRDKVVVELGSGTALPSIVAAMQGAKVVFATDRDNVTLQDNLKHCLALNPMAQGVAHALPLDWSHPQASVKTLLAAMGGGEERPPPRVDVVLAADVFYSSEAFNDIVHVIAELLATAGGQQQQQEPNGLRPVCYTTYQERSSTRTLVPHLDMYKLSAELVPLSTFLHSAHNLGLVEMHQIEANGARRRKVEQRLLSFDDVYLLKISLR